MILFLHRFPSSSSSWKKKRKPRQPFRKVKEYRARIRSIPRPRNKLDDMHHLTSRYVNIGVIFLAVSVVRIDPPRTDTRNDILYFAHVSSLLFHGFTRFLFILYLRKRARWEFYYSKLCVCVWMYRILQLQRSTFVTHYLTYLKFIFP